MRKRTILELARDAADNILRNGQACPRDTDGDGDCGRPLCPVCGIRPSLGAKPQEQEAEKNKKKEKSS